MSGLGPISIASRVSQINQISNREPTHNVMDTNNELNIRQRVNLSAETPQKPSGNSYIGSGLKVESITKHVDNFVERQLIKGEGLVSKAKAKHEILSGIESLFNESSNSKLNNSVGAMFNSWQELSRNPESSIAKSIVAEKSRIFTEQINRSAKGLQESKENLENQMSKDIVQFNQSIEKVESLNEKMILLQRSGYETTDLLAYRDNLIKDVNRNYGTDVTFDHYGRASLVVQQTILSPEEKVSIVQNIEEDGDNMLVSFYEGGNTSKLKTVSVEKSEKYQKNSPVVYSEKHSTLTALEKPPHGKISGQMDSLSYIEEKQSELDNFAKGMKFTINKVHGEEILSGDSAMDLQVNKRILEDPRKIQANKSSYRSDGEKALAISSLRNSKIDFTNLSNNEFDEVNMKFADKVINPEKFLQEFTESVGIDSQDAEKEIEIQEALLAQMQNRKDIGSSLSIEKEIANIVKQQRVYDSNIRGIGAINNLLKDFTE